MTVDRKLATEVAKQLERRRLRRRLLVLALLAAAIVLVITYLTCGQGFGLGGKGKGKGEGSGTGKAIAALPDAAPARCAVRVHAKGITVDGKDVTREQAVTACKATPGADVVITGDARQGDWDELRAAFEQAGVTVYVRE
ncbi:MAG TPA: hypothetical protein VM513_15700 [Kofleriaceae bacterium]|nr:hypothetical protein [Kofleriaceae bacterium]